MKFREEEMRALAGLPDCELWAEVKRMAKNFGVSLGEKAPPHEDLQKLRELLNGDRKMRFSEAAKILAEYREKNGGR